MQWILGYCAAPLALMLGAIVLTGCGGVQRDTPIQVWDDMKHQNKFKAQSSINEEDDSMKLPIFVGGRISQMPVADTVARGHLRDDSAVNTGLENGMFVGKLPVPVTPELLAQGQVKFNTYCSPCHDQTGSGRGIVPARVPTWQPSNLTEDRLVEAADGDIFNTITYGRRTMPAYRFQIPASDRWAIVSYVRVLQRAAHGKADEVPADKQAELTAQVKK
jgi:mono/diheme cytochrome c family protein